MNKWQDSGPDMGRFVRENPELWQSLQRQVQKLRVLVSPDNTGIAYGRPPAPGLKATLAAIGNKDGLAAVWRDEAQLFFLWFLSNPLRQRLGGPCARCGQYFRRRTKRNPKVYCSRLCGWRATGTAAIKQQRKKDHADKLDRAAEAARQWSAHRTDLGWKQWVSRKEPDISVQFLTRAVNKGELRAPVRQ